MRLLNRITKAKANAKAECDAQKQEEKRMTGGQPFLEGFYSVSYEI
jgi:hypothetical protein